MSVLDASKFVGGVALTPCLSRVLHLPRRNGGIGQYDDEQIRYLVQRMTELCKTPQGTMTLLPLQAVCLFELSLSRGIFGGLGTGEGKTLISLLAPLVASAWRPMLILPANLIAKTERDRLQLSQHWRIPVTTRVESYQKLCLAQHVDMLDEYQPNFIVCDEAHRLRSLKNGATRRVNRYMQSRPDTRFVALSGTMTTSTIRDFEHLARWSLGATNAPLPLKFGEMDQWSLALDEREGKQQIDPYALYHLCTPEEKAMGRTGARKGFRRRMSDTPGVVLSEGASCNASIIFRTLAPSVPNGLLRQVDTMRANWESPNGEAFEDAFTRDRHTRTMLTGYYGYWEPAAPREWLSARRLWASTCRYIINNNHRRLDSEKPVIAAVKAGLYPGDPVEALARWEAIKPTFVPNPVPRWLDYYLITWLRDHLRRAEPSLVWCSHVPFARELQRVTGLPLYEQNGIDERTGRLADDADPTQHAILSIHSNSEGRNLQQFSRNIVVSPPSNNKIVEQMLSRTHRRGQQADEIFFDWILSHEAQHAAVERVVRQANYGQDLLLGRQKILLGSWV